MSAYVENLGRAVRLLRRLSDLGQTEYEGATLTEIVGDVLMAQHQAITQEAVDRVAFRCNVDESAGMAEVYELHSHSRKVPCA